MIDRPHRFGKKKARFATGNSPKGYWWCPPGVDLLEVKELWIVEGIFDAIALLHHGITAVSAMSSGAFPAESLKELARQRGGKLPRLVWALDNEPGAHRYTRKHVTMAAALGYESSAAQIPQRDSKMDWNDLHQRWQFIDNTEQRIEQRERDFKAARYHGALLLAESAAEKGALMYEWRERHEFHFAFEKSTRSSARPRTSSRSCISLSSCCGRGRGCRRPSPWPGRTSTSRPARYGSAARKCEACTR